jgi:HK97 family phage major capsid protein
MATKSQLKMQELRAKAIGIEQAQGDGVWTPEAMAAYKSIVTEAEALREQIDTQVRMEALKTWSEAPNGQSAVRSTFDRDATPGEGMIEGVTQDDTGELAAYDSEGEKRLKVLKSAAYQDAFAQHIRAKSKLGAEWRGGLKAAAMKILQVGQDEAGGFWMPPEYRTELIKKMATMATVRPNATVITTGSDLVSFPAVKYTTDQKYTSGVRFSWNGEAPASNIPESTNPVAGRLNIPINVASATIFITRSMMEDNAFDVLGYCSELFAEAFTLGEEDVFWNGAGAGTPEGIFTHPAASVAHGTNDGMLVNSGHASALTWGAANAPSAGVTKGILGIETALPPQYEMGAKWYANKSTYSAVRALSDTQQRPLWQTTDAPGLTNYVRGLPQTLLGYGVEKSQFLPDIAANSKPMLFGDLKGYYIADRVGLSIEVFREVLGLRDLVAIYARKRVGAGLLQPWRAKILQIAA